MRVVAAILAAGRGERFGQDKTRMLLGGEPLWRWSYRAFASHPKVNSVLLVGSAENLAELAVAGPAILGGKTRQESSLAALDTLESGDLVLIHDAARPFPSEELITRVIDAALEVGAAAPAIPIIDTIRRRSDDGWELLDRTELVGMQTPQAARVDVLRRAHTLATTSFTDDVELLQRAGVAVEIVPGDPKNFKVTTPEDFRRAQESVGSAQVRTGLGYDVHAFSDDPGRACVLGGVTFLGERGLEGHSDADVLLHAVTDALLGAAALGDIGQHFRNDDPQWKGRESTHFLGHAAHLVRAAGWEVLNVDATVIAEMPKIMPQAAAIRTAIALAIGISVDRVSVKATTNERLGTIGRGEGIAAFAIATLSGYPRTPA